MRIACVLDSGFEDSEFKKPYDSLRQAGHEVVVVGLVAGQELTGYKGTVTTRTEKSFDDVRPDSFDALLIPGGYSPDHLRADRRAVAGHLAQARRSGRLHPRVGDPARAGARSRPLTRPRRGSPPTP